MVKISGWIYLVIGGAVAAYSKFIQTKIDSPGMTLFFWAGILMLGVGVFKLVMSFIFSNKMKQEQTPGSFEDRVANKLGFSKDLPKIDAEKLQRERDMILNRTSSIVVCPSCGTKHYSNSRFCHMCGTRLK